MFKKVNTIKKKNRYILSLFAVGLICSIGTVVAAAEWYVEEGSVYEYSLLRKDADVVVKGSFIVTVETIAVTGVLTYSIDFDANIEGNGYGDVASNDTETSIMIKDNFYSLIQNKANYDALNYSTMDEIYGEEFEGFTVSGSCDEKSFDFTLSGYLEGVSIQMAMEEKWNEEGVLVKSRIYNKMYYMGITAEVEETIKLKSASIPGFSFESLSFAMILSVASLLSIPKHKK
jgi:hypothetical protein